MPEFRKSALMIHGLGSKDRQWMLERLSEEQRVKLQPLLEELQLLGIPKTGLDTALVDPSPGSEAVSLEAADMTMVNNTDAAEMNVLLQYEPPQVIAAILSIHDWDWRARLLKQFSRERQQSVARAIELGRRNGLSPKLQQSILTSLEGLLRSTREQRLLANNPDREFVYQRRPGVVGQLWRSLWPA